MPCFYDCNVTKSFLFNSIFLFTEPYLSVWCNLVGFSLLCSYCSYIKTYGNNYMYTDWGGSTMPVHESNICSAQSMYAHRYGPICQSRKANYPTPCDIVLKPCISFCNIKTYVARAAQMVSMSMNALENFGRGFCIRTPQGYQHATPLLVCHSSSHARAEKEAVGSDAFSQLGRLMKVI